MTDTVPAFSTRPSLWQVLLVQRKTVNVALAFVVAALWILSQLDSWLTAFCAAAGVLLGLANHVATEYWLAGLIASGEQPSRSRIARATFARLTILSVVAVTAAVVMWPSGIALLLGLAIFRLIALVMTTIPLLKELKNA
ncbi:MAG: hypothetical protein QOK15_415 [Nocardioidaceae bacterium]|nr:hypothetical protein [Nocardioidaceae bacterium]